MTEAWSHVLLQLTVEQLLATRQVCYDWQVKFQFSLPSLCVHYDIHHCSTVKEFITALSHLHYWWRRTPSFSRMQNKHFPTISKFRKILCAVLSIEASFSLTSSRMEEDNLNDRELLTKLSTESFTRGHTFLLSVYKAAQKRSPAVQYAVFSTLVKKGVPPYYLELFLSHRLFAVKLTGSKYLSLITGEQNEYLLKRELKANRTPTVPGEWERGREIAAKYKKRRSRNYRR